MMRRFTALLLALLLPACSYAAGQDSMYTKWAAYYGKDASPEQLQMFDLLVLDPEFHPPLRTVFSSNRTVLAYLSLGELKSGHQADRLLKDRAAILDKNQTWDSHHVDIRNPAWMALVIEQLVPSLLQQGFDGVMLDTLDSSIGLEAGDKQKYAGMQKAATELVRALRENYPDMKIMINRGFEILPDVAQDVDMVLAESIFTTYNFKTKKFQRVPDEHYTSIVNFLTKLEQANPRLQIYSLDYWPTEDAKGLRTIYDTQRKNGLVPYVATVDLQQLIAEPEPQGDSQ